MCGNPLKILGGLVAPKVQQVLMPQQPANTAGAATDGQAADATVTTKKRARSLLSAAGAAGDTSGAVVSTGGAVGKTQLGG